MPQVINSYPYGDTLHVIANQAQLDWMLNRWSGYRGVWRVGYSQVISNIYLNEMLYALGERFGEAYQKPPLVRWWTVDGGAYRKPALVKWWDVEAANLPLDIPPPT